MKMNKKLKKGFTLVELVVVIAVIAILAGVSVGAYFGITESAKNSQVEQEAKAVHTSITLVANDPKYASTMTNDGLVLDAKFEKDLEEVTGLDYVVAAEGITFTASGTKTTYPKITFGGKNKVSEVDYWTTFTYAIDEGHSATYYVVTGAKVPANA